MQGAIRAEHAMAGDDERDGVGRLGAAYGAGSVDLAHLEGNCAICGGLAIRYQRREMECLLLKR